MRKFLFLCIFLPFFMNLHAQELDGITVDSLLVNIDQTSLTTHVLYDRVMPLAQLSIFNDSINIANTPFYEQAINELYNASEHLKFASYQDVRNLYSPDSLQNVVDLAIINASFQILNYNESNESLGALRITDSLFERNQNNQPIFLEKHVFLVSPTKKFLVGPDVTFVINPDLVLQDTNGKNIEELTVNFDTNQDYVVISNGNIQQASITIPYQDSGDKIITLTAQFADGSSKTTQGTFNYLPAPPPSGQFIENGSIWGNLYWQGFNESNAYRGKLDYRIFYPNAQKKLMKPIVFIDGFDPGDKRKIQDSDPHPNLSNEDHKSIEEMMNFTDNNGSTQNLIPILNGLGYDVVIVNHPIHFANGFKMDGGADYIERNGLTHVNLYQFLNSKLAQNNSQEQLVIVGPSMGGQISRYALSYMEKNNLTHNARLWVSVDSPHLGANIPMGVQSLLNLLKDVAGSVEAADYVDNQLGSPAARQQLIEQYCGSTNGQLNTTWLDGRTVSQGFSQNNGRPIFINYYNNLFNNGLPGSHGYPQNLRKVAMVNGSLTGSKAFLNPFENGGYEEFGTPYNDQYANHGAKSLKIEGFANIIGHMLTVESYFMPNTGDNHKIAYFKKKNIIWQYYDRYISNLNSRGNMDNIPGGWFPTQAVLAESIVESTPCSWFFGQICINDWDIETIEQVGSFIPTISALGLLNPDFQWNSPLNRNLVCTNETPFDSYFGSNLNTEHTSFSFESVQWFLQEIAGLPQPPTVYFTGDNLMGPQEVCQQDIVTFEFDSCTPTSVINWQVSSGLQIITSDEASVTVQNVTSSNTSGWIKAFFENQVVQKDIWLNKPLLPTYLDGPTVVATGAIVTYSGGISEGATSYEWWLPYPFEVQNPYDINGPNWQIYPNAGRTTQVFTGNAGTSGYVQLMGENSCGLSDAQILEVEHGQGGAGQQQLPVYPYPNTSDDAFSLDFSTYPTGSYQIYIYDPYSNIIYEGSSENIEKTISTLDMPNGTYFLHIHTGEDVLQYQLIIVH